VRSSPVGRHHTCRQMMPMMLCGKPLQMKAEDPVYFAHSLFRAHENLVHLLAMHPKPNISKSQKGIRDRSFAHVVRVGQRCQHAPQW
jgi:hypothetical protein